VNLTDNPIFLTQKRLVHRGGVLAAIIIATLLGLSLFSGLVAYLANPTAFRFDSPEDAGRMFYGWIVIIEGVILVLGGFSRVSRALSDDRKAGLWDSNRITPLKPSQLVTGYWFGSGLREFYMAIAFAVIGLAVVLLAKLPITLWLGSQVLLLSTACLFGLIGLLVGMAFERSGILLVVAAFILCMFSLVAPGRMLPNFLLPIFGLNYLFQNPNHPGYQHQWDTPPSLFGLSLPPVILTLGIQFLVGFFLWRAAVRKTARPSQPLLLRWEAIALFAILVIIQHGLLWSIWQGHFPHIMLSGDRNYESRQSLLSAIHAATICLAIIILTCASPQPEVIRLESLRRGFKGVGPIFSRSAVPLAVALAVIAGTATFTQCIFSLDRIWNIVAIVCINLVELFVAYALLLEFCRVRHQKRAVGFLALWLFILWALPFIFALVFFDSDFAKLSMLAPGFHALDNPDTASSWDLLFLAELAHGAIIIVLFSAWFRQWKRLLAKTSTT